MPDVTNPTHLISSSPEGDIQQPESCRLHIPNREGAVSDCSRDHPGEAGGKQKCFTATCPLKEISGNTLL